MFVDASCIVAILTQEPDADALIDRLEGSARPITSAIAIFEATLALCRRTYVSVEEAEADVTAFLTAAGITIVPIGAHEATAALLAFARYGRGRGHPAQLNMADCFAYAVAKGHRTSVLYAGNAFDKTDIVTGS
jgi:ribonuclease VapC